MQICVYLQAHMQICLYYLIIFLGREIGVVAIEDF